MGEPQHQWGVGKGHGLEPTWCRTHHTQHPTTQGWSWGHVVNQRCGVGSRGAKLESAVGQRLLHEHHWGMGNGDTTSRLFHPKWVQLLGEKTHRYNHSSELVLLLNPHPPTERCDVQCRCGTPQCSQEGFAWLLGVALNSSTVTRVGGDRRAMGTSHGDAQESTTLPHSSDFLTKELLNVADLCAKSLAPTPLYYSLKMALS